MKVLKCFNLVDKDGTPLRLNLGVLEDTCDLLSSNDKGYRWRFLGSNIPMPVRNGTWFNGFQEATMMNWLMGHGWALVTKVDMLTGRAYVYNLPKGNEEPVTSECDIHNVRDRAAFEDSIRYLVDNGKRITATKMYRYTHGGTLHEAHMAVREICDET